MIKKIIATLLAVALLSPGWPAVPKAAAAVILDKDFYRYTTSLDNGDYEGKLLNRRDFTEDGSIDPRVKDVANWIPALIKSESYKKTPFSYPMDGNKIFGLAGQEFKFVFNMGQAASMAEYRFSGKSTGNVEVTHGVSQSGDRNEQMGYAGKEGDSFQEGWTFGRSQNHYILIKFIEDATVSDLELYVRDLVEPTLERVDVSVEGGRFHQNAWYLNVGDKINVDLIFNRPVIPVSAEAHANMTGAGGNRNANYLSSELLRSPAGDGFPASISTMVSFFNISLTDRYYMFSPANSKFLVGYGAGVGGMEKNKKYSLSYTIKSGDTSGHRQPLDFSWLVGDVGDDRHSLIRRINAAQFIDDAGNRLVVDQSNFVDMIANNTNIYIDSRSPKYSTVRNGVQPNIPSGLVLRQGQPIPFTLYFNEPVFGKLDSYYNTSLAHYTRLMLSGGNVANYVSGDGADEWEFLMYASNQETALLQTDKLVNDYPVYGRPSELWDYSKNILTESVPSIAWADLSIDNTPPVIAFELRNDQNIEVPIGQYMKGGSFVVQATDPNLNGEPSKGLFRPSGDSGLVYYWISRSPDNPFAGKEADRLAAVKRYSLALKQPSEELYPSELEHVTLGVANNGDSIPLPAEAEGSAGDWYMHTWVADMTWDSARQLKQYNKGAALRESYLAEHPDATPLEIETNYRENILPGLSQYDDQEIWPLSDFKEDDSNWSYKVASMKLENDLPVVTAGEIVDNDSEKVQMTFTATDPTTSIRDGKVEYQIVKKGESPDPGAWQEVALNGEGKASVTTEGAPAIDRSGAYELYVRANDSVGHEAVVNVLEVSVLVIFTQFEEDSDDYAINEGMGFTIAGISSDRIESIDYQFTTSSVRPAGASGWTAFQEDSRESAVLQGEEGMRYSFPVDPTLNGNLYAHVRVKLMNKDSYHYYTGEYKFDHLPPNVTFSSQGYLYPMPEQTARIAVVDTLVDFTGVAPERVFYQWQKVTEDEEESEPNPDSVLWEQVPLTGEVKLAADSKAADGNYRLYVHAKDSLGNAAIYKTDGLFATYHLSPEPPTGSAELIKVENGATPSYEAILQLAVDAPSQEGYFYSISTNGGVNWSTWRPFTNYVGVPVATNDTERLAEMVKVKFKGYYGTNISEVYSPTVRVQADPVYALASLEQNEPVRGGERRSSGGKNDGLLIVFDGAEGKTIAPTLANPEPPELVTENKRYRVYRNGTYSFTVKEGNESANIYIVVSNFDDKEPVVQVKYSTFALTNGSVRASLEANEPIRITNLDTRFRTFRENGEFTFEFEDAVGWTGTAIATVGNIDKTPPEADIVLHYNNDALRAIIAVEDKQVVVNSSGYGYDAQGVLRYYGLPTTDNVLAANRIVAELRPKSGMTQDYQVVKNSTGKKNATIVVTSGNGASFTIADAAGNTSVVKTPTLSTLVTSVPKVARTNLQRIDADGNGIPEEELVLIDGQAYSKGKMRVTLDMEDAPAIAGNSVSIGSQDIASFQRDYSNNMKATLTLSDRIGNQRSHSFLIEGLDNEAPKLTLNKPTIAIALNKPNYDFVVDLGGYTVTDNVSAAEDIEVHAYERVQVGDIYEDRLFVPSQPGKYVLRVIARDQVGNESVVLQNVYVTSNNGMFVTANSLPLSDTISDTAIVNSTTVTFEVQNYGVIQTSGGKKVNEVGTYDILYFPGLVREGQMKYIAKKVAYEELVNGSFTVTLPKTGWYTVIIRNQEREQVYATLLISGNR